MKFDFCPWCGSADCQLDKEKHGTKRGGVMKGFWAYWWKSSFNRSWIIVLGWIGYLVVLSTLLVLFTEWIEVPWLAVVLAIPVGWYWRDFKTLLYGDVE